MRRLLLAMLFVGLVVNTALSTVRAEDDKPATVVPMPRDGGWIQRHEQFNNRAKQGDVDLIFLGDSITQGWEGKDAQEVWQKYYGDRKAMNAGIGGDRTQHVLWRLENGNIAGIKPKLAVIMIGTNNAGGDTSEDIALGIKAIVAKLREKLPETKILLLGIFPRGPSLEDKARIVTAKANYLAKSVADDKNVFYLDIGPKFVESDGTISKEIMPDLLHLSPKGYEIWAKSIEPAVWELLGDKPHG
jgi:lysophospholipase L1-like esterase